MSLTAHGPLISVVIPTYNRAGQTIVAIESVLAQTYRHFEIIVVDDGSTDNTESVLRQFLQQKSSEWPRILMLSQANRGPSTARNVGMSRASGEYIAFLDSDDVWYAEKLERQVRAIQLLDGRCGACFTDARLVNSKGMELSSFNAHGRRYRQAVGIDDKVTMALAESFSGLWLSTLLVRADVVRAVGGFSASIGFAEDRDFHFRLSLVTSVGYVNDELIVSNRDPSPAGTACRPWDQVDVQFREQQRMLETWLTIDGLPLEVRRTVQRSLGGLHSQRANWYLENALYPEARQAVSRALMYKITAGTTAKLALTWLAPALARRITPKTRPIGTDGHAS